MPSRIKPLGLDHLPAANIKRMREERGWSQDELARRMSLYGFRWSKAVVAALESDGRHLSVEEKIALALEFQATQQDLYRTSKRTLPLSGDLVITREGLQHFLEGKVIPDESLKRTARGQARVDTAIRHRTRMQKLISIRQRTQIHRLEQGELERHIAKKLSESTYNVVAVALHLWGRSPSDEREARAVDRPRAKQHISRELIAEIEEVFGREAKKKTTRRRKS